MNFQHLTVDHEPSAGGVVERARTVASLLFDAAPAADEQALIAPQTWAMLRQSGLLMAPFPARLGGQDLCSPARHADLATVLRLLGWGDLCIARLFEGHANAVALVLRYGTDVQAAGLAEAVSAGGLSGVWGAEDAKGLKVEKTRAGWRLDGRKIFASGAGAVSHPVVPLRHGEAQIMLLPSRVPSERADVSGWTAQGMRASATGAVDFTGFVVSDDGRLGRDGDFLRQPHFSGGAWRFCAVHLGGAERLVDLFREHLVARRRDADPYQVQRVAHCVAAVTSARFWVEAAARRLAEETDTPERAVAFVNMTRMVTERAALDVLEAVHRGVGLAGFLRPHPIERVSRDLSTYLRQPVPDLAMSDAGSAALASPEATGDLWGPLS